MKKQILVCDHCGIEGHDPKRPDMACITALKAKVKALVDELTVLKNRQHITIPVTPSQPEWPQDLSPLSPHRNPFYPPRDNMIVD